MAWLYVPGLGESNLESSSPVPNIEPSVTWRGKPIRPRTWSREWKMGSWIKRLSGLTYEPSTRQRGVDAWISSLQARPALPSVLLPVGVGLPSTCSPMCSGSSQNASQAPSSWRTFQDLLEHCERLHSSCEGWVMKPRALLKFPPPRWLVAITGPGFSYLPTPTAKANHCSPSMKKWPAYDAFQRLTVGAKSPPVKFWEAMMGFPIGWTGLEPVVTELFQQWQRAHSLNLWRAPSKT